MSPRRGRPPGVIADLSPDDVVHIDPTAGGCNKRGKRGEPRKAASFTEAQRPRVERVNCPECIHNISHTLPPGVASLTIMAGQVVDFRLLSPE